MAGRWVIGVDLGGSKARVGLVGEDGRVAHRVARAVAGLDQAALLDTVSGAVAEARAAAPPDVDVVGAGFGIPSLLDSRRGTSVVSVHLPLADVPFADVMRERLGLPVWVDNDGNAALLAESRMGAARGAEHAVLLTLGTGVGGGLLLSGELYRGADGAAAELGHMVIDRDGPPCHGHCPNRGCLEAVVSGSALARAGRAAAASAPDSALGRAQRSGREVDGPLVTALAEEGDAVARALLERMGTALGVGLANLVNLFNPEVVVIGGGMAAAGELLLAPARRTMRARALPPSRDTVDVRLALLGDDAGLVGAALLARDGVAAGAPERA